MLKSQKKKVEKDKNYPTIQQYYPKIIQPPNEF